jgi:hypothetical protein
MKSKLQVWCLIIGVGLWGPIILGLAITCLFVGEIPGRRGPLVRAVDNPAIFYAAAIAFIIIAAKFTQVTCNSAHFFYSQAKRRGSL